MDNEALFDLLDAIQTDAAVSGKQPLPGLSTEVIESLKLQGNPVAALAGETTDKEYRVLQRHRNVISNSILAGLHSCPRRLLLEKLLANRPEKLQVTPPPNIDFVFGHAVGSGVQALFAFNNIHYALYAAFLSWRAPFEFGHEDYLARKHKTIEKSVLAVEMFSYFMRSEALDEWEIFRFEDGRPAIEVSFCIDLGKYKYFGHIDLVLKNKRTGRIAIGELKTTGFSNPDEAIFGNSLQALGYSIVLDTVVGELADYDVMYFAYSAPSKQWNFFPFAKSRSMKMEWIQDRLIDAGHLDQYYKLRHFPKNGASCLQFNRRCQFYGECNLVDKAAMDALPTLSGQGDEYPVDYYFHVQDVIDKQVEL
jgi:hypothetical protein